MMARDRIIMVGKRRENRGPQGVAKKLDRCFRRVEGYRFIDLGDLDRFGGIKAAYEVAGARDAAVCIQTEGFSFPLLVMIFSLIRRRKCARLFYVAHGVAAVEGKYRPVSSLDLVLERTVIKRFPRVICVSDFQKETLSKLFGRSRGISVIPNGVEPASAALREVKQAQTMRFLTMGGFERRKGTEWAVRIVASLVKAGYDCELLICGLDTVESGSARGTCEELIDESGIRSRVRYLGEIEDRQEIARLYESASFLFALSEFDTFNCAVLEAASFGAIPVVSAQSGSSMLFSQGGAIVANLDDSNWENEVIARIEHMADNPDELSEAMDRARAVAQARTWDQVAREYLELLVGDGREASK